MLVLILLFGLFLEALMYLSSPVWRIRKLWTAGLIVINFSWLISWAFMYEWVALPAVVIVLWRIFSLMRIIKGQLNDKFLRSTLSRTGYLLILCQLGCLTIQLLDIQAPANSIYLLATSQLLTASIILAVTMRNLHRNTYHSTLDYIEDKDLPTVTIAIPARNETADLSSCLQTLVSSDYSKLEILVLDDCSQDRTAEIIKGFAQDGVRFIKGEEPSESWLSKNQAYQSLYKQANGEIIIFCGVDVRFGPESVRSMITNMIHKNRDMMSVMPLRVGGGVRTAFIQPMRYWWEIALPRRYFNRPAVLSTCWAIKRQSLKALGGFGAVSNAIIPEGYFARELIKHDKYTFTRANEVLDVRTVKSIEDQLETSIRTRYPQLKKRIENVLLLSLAELVYLLVPFLITLSGFWLGFNLLQWLAIVTSILLIATHHLILASTNPANSVVALFNLPFVVVTEIALLYISMYKYEFSTVEWKGRNVCIPVMKVVPRLPNLQ